MIENTKAPDFKITLVDGTETMLSECLKTQSVIVHFFPKAFTGTCKEELCSIRDDFNERTHPELLVVAVSCDTKEDLAKWIKEENFGLAYASDFEPRGQIARSFDAMNSDLNIADRKTFLVKRDGTIAWTYGTEVGSARDIEEYRKALSLLA